MIIFLLVSSFVHLDHVMERVQRERDRANERYKNDPIIARKVILPDPCERPNDACGFCNATWDFCHCGTAGGDGAHLGATIELPVQPTGSTSVDPGVVAPPPLLSRLRPARVPTPVSEVIDLTKDDHCHFKPISEEPEVIEISDDEESLESTMGLPPDAQEIPPATQEDTQTYVDTEEEVLSSGESTYFSRQGRPAEGQLTPEQPKRARPSTPPAPRKRTTPPESPRRNVTPPPAPRKKVCHVFFDRTCFSHCGLLPYDHKETEQMADDYYQRTDRTLFAQIVSWHKDAKSKEWCKSIQADLNTWLGVDQTEVVQLLDPSGYYVVSIDFFFPAHQNYLDEMCDKFGVKSNCLRISWHQFFLMTDN